MDERKEYQRAYKEKYRQSHKGVHVTLTLDEYQQIMQLAEQHNLKIPSMLKQLAFTQLGGQQPVPSALLDLIQEHNRLVRSIANNLNQLAHSANIFQEVDQKLVFDHLRELHNQMDAFVKQSFDNGGDTASKQSKP